MSKGIVAVSGASGFIGTHLCRHLLAQGYKVWPMTRKRPASGDVIYYNYRSGRIDIGKIAQCSAVIHLAGKNLMAGAWKENNRQELYDSRVKSTKLIAQTLASLKDGPKVFLCASALGFYGDRAGEKLVESSHSGAGFLAHICKDWEAASHEPDSSSVRVVSMRFGAVLDKSGGMLKRLLPIFKLGLGGVLGDGEQYLSFIAMSDLCRMVERLLSDENISGPVNMVTPTPITNTEFTKALAAGLKRPSCMRVPTWALKLFMGEQASVALNSNRAYPEAMIDAGFDYEYPTIADYFGDGKNI